MLPEYGSLQPATLEEAIGAMAGVDDVLPIAGGTNVVMAMREGEHRGKTLMDVTRLAELRGIRLENGHVVLGGGTTAAEVLDSVLVAEHGRPLHQAAAVFANPLIRNRATVAGNIADASPAADTAPPLLVLGTEVELVSASGTRWIPLDEFMVGVNQTMRRPDELIVAFRLRKGSACSVLSVAVMVTTDGKGHVSQARIALGAVAARPIRAYRAEGALAGQALTEDVIEAAARLAAEATKPIDDVRSSATYRQRMAGILTRRLLATAADGLGQE
jgi:CO/xanthine dehydrogenase FAD-binding subunit